MKKELSDHQRCVLPIILLHLLDKLTMGGNLSDNLDHFSIDKQMAAIAIDLLVARELIVPVVGSITFPQGIRVTNIVEGRTDDFRESIILTKAGKRCLAEYNIENLRARWFKWQK